MRTYHKIDTVFKRDPATKHKTLLEGQYSRPEFEYLRDSPWAFSEKFDGTNMRVGWVDGKLEWRGRTDRANLASYMTDTMEETFRGHEDWFEARQGVILFGELVGHKIQAHVGHHYSTDGHYFVLFDVWGGTSWLPRLIVQEIGDALNVLVAPIVTIGTLEDLVDRARWGAESQYNESTRGDFPLEGYIARPTTELCDRHGSRIITKIKLKDFAS